MNPLLIRHRLFSVLLKDIVTPEFFEDEAAFNYYREM